MTAKNVHKTRQITSSELALRDALRHDDLFRYVIGSDGIIVYHGSIHANLTFRQLENHDTFLTTDIELAKAYSSNFSTAMSYDLAEGIIFQTNPKYAPSLYTVKIIPGTVLSLTLQDYGNGNSDGFVSFTGVDNLCFAINNVDRLKIISEQRVKKPANADAPEPEYLKCEIRGLAPYKP